MKKVLLHTRSFGCNRPIGKSLNLESRVSIIDATKADQMAEIFLKVMVDIKKEIVRNETTKIIKPMKLTLVSFF
uniref:Uncharacterized protein n=1 Tax=Romanomermis culicivorax TaxID=13658 RepID=A0A915K2F4_ROMCU